MPLGFFIFCSWYSAFRPAAEFGPVDLSPFILLASGPCPGIGFALAEYRPSPGRCPGGFSILMHGDCFMKRQHVNKKKSAKVFRKHVSHTKSANTAQAPMRGGWRL